MGFRSTGNPFATLDMDRSRAAREKYVNRVRTPEELDFAARSKEFDARQRAFSGATAGDRRNFFQNTRADNPNASITEMYGGLSPELQAERAWLDENNQEFRGISQEEIRNPFQQVLQGPMAGTVPNFQPQQAFAQGGVVDQLGAIAQQQPMQEAQPLQQPIQQQPVQQQPMQQQPVQQQPLQQQQQQPQVGTFGQPAAFQQTPLGALQQARYPQPQVQQQQQPQNLQGQMTRRFT